MDESGYYVWDKYRVIYPMLTEDCINLMVVGAAETVFPHLRGCAFDVGPLRYNWDDDLYECKFRPFGGCWYCLKLRGFYVRSRLGPT